MTKTIEDYLTEFEGKFSAFHTHNLSQYVFKKELKGFLRTALIEQKEESAEIVRLILPLAKGYVFENRIEANQKYIKIAEKFISQKP